MNTYHLFWSPEGREIATVLAKNASAAKRKAPKPYRKYLGEIYVTVDAPRQFVDVSADQYTRFRNTSYTGGSAWYTSPDFPGGHVVLACTPVEVRRYFDANPNGSTRGEFVQNTDR